MMPNGPRHSSNKRLAPAADRFETCPYGLTRGEAKNIAAVPNGGRSQTKKKEAGLCFNTKTNLIAGVGLEATRSLRHPTQLSEGFNLGTAQHGAQFPNQLCAGDGSKFWVRRWHEEQLAGCALTIAFLIFLPLPWCRVDTRPCQPNRQPSPAAGKLGELSARTRHESCSSYPYTRKG